MVPVGAQRSYLGEVFVGDDLIVVSEELSVGAGPYVLIGKLFATALTGKQGTVVCQLRTPTAVLDSSAVYLNSGTAPVIPMTLVATATLPTGPQKITITCEGLAGGTGQLRDIQLVAIRVNTLDEPN